VAAPPETTEAGRRFDELVALIARLRAPGGCPWDREQTHQSVKPMTIEEAYEVAEAIDEGDDHALASELGDLALQVVFHAQIAAEEKRFAVSDVLVHVIEKMVRRHPHVFGAETAHTPEQVLRNWEKVKEAEATAKQGAAPESMLDGVSAGLPGILEAFQMTTKVARVGFDWPDRESVVAKLDEEVAELKEALDGEGGTAPIAEEIGDLLFVAVNVARVLGIDPESALKAANRKFRRRFRHVEDRLRESGRRPGDSTLQEMDALWEEAKERE
jgi:tetrapyrrole methylase family protein / MazG family protein